MKYEDHISHYQVDGEFFDYINPGETRKAEILRRHQHILRLLRPEQGETVLDLGSGGGMAGVMGTYECSYLPLDLSMRNLERIRAGTGDIIAAICGDVYNLPCEDESLDLAVMSEVVEHLANPGAALEEVRRVLVPAGKVAVSVPCEERLTYQICVHCNKPTPTNAHLHSFSRASLERLLKEAGFTPIRFSTGLNKVINRLHITRLLKKLPFPLWKCLDTTATLLIDKPAYMICVAEKR